jgi:hypothetical protein
MEEEKQMAQIQSAKRSLVTNLICITAFFMNCILVFFLPVQIRAYCSVTFFTFLKGLMPVLSTVANFGTVQSVFLQYKDNFFQLRVVKRICKARE